MRLARIQTRADETSAVPTRLRPLFAAPLAVAVLAAGCGPAPKSERSAASGLTRQEYAARADAICERMLDESKSLRGRPRQQQLQQALAIQARMIHRLRALTPPRGDERAVGTVLRRLERLQAAAKALVRTEGEEVLGAAAAIAVEMDAVDQASRRYGLFRRCGAFRVSPKLHELIHAPKPTPLAPTPRPRQTSDLDAAARDLVPQGRRVLAQADCGGGGQAFCVTISLEPSRASVRSRRAAFLRRALQRGWTEIVPDDRGRGGVLLLRRGDREAVVWVSPANCKAQPGDGPDSAPAARRCVDTIMLHTSF